MDTLTHALSGALAARGTSALQAPPARQWAALSAAAFPDIDYALYWLAPEHFLNWHRGLTHSLILAPVWAALLAALWARLRPQPRGWRAYFGACLLGLAVHLVGDVVTIYGTKLLAPLSDRPFALELVFDVDPWLGLIVILGLTASFRVRPKWAALVTLLVAAAYLSLQWQLREQVTDIGERELARRDDLGGTVRALPQPFGPPTWSLLLGHGDLYDQSFVAPLGALPTTLDWQVWPLKLLPEYRPAGALRWRTWTRAERAARAAVGAAWQAPAMASFRRFAKVPALYGVEHSASRECVWFTDLRHALPTQPPPFRQGVCRDGGQAQWRLYRMGYFSDEAPEALD